MTPAKVLIVEDDRIVARDIQQQLLRIGHAVVGMTAMGEEAVNLALTCRPDIVLMDIRLQGELDGVEAAQRIRRECQIPVIFLTAYADDETVRRASLSEPYGYLLKPLENSQLRTIIEMALYKHGAERRLRESERRYSATLSSIGDAVIATDAHGFITFLNPVAEAMTGWASSEAVGQRLSGVFRIANEDTREVIEDPVAEVLRSKKVVALANHAMLISRDGRMLPIDDLGSPIIDDTGALTGTVLVFRDLSEKRRLEDSLREAQIKLANVSRLMTLGELAVSIAHEINQPLAAIVVNASAGLNFLGHQPANLAEGRSVLSAILGDGTRAAEVIRSLLALARRASPVFSRLDVDEVIHEVLLLTRGELRRHGVAVHCRLSSDGVHVRVDRVQIQQVLLNLILNALEAMSGLADRPRVLTISSELSASKEVVVSVEDNGVGIDSSNLEHLFDAFFTTKASGMGMGLSICRSLVENHGGRLTAAKADPFGAVFAFAIPLAPSNEG